MSTVDLRDVVFGWGTGQPLLEIDRLEVAPGERVFISGPSGSGKSTLLGLIGGVLTPTSGSVRVLGESLGELSAARRDRLRVDHIGFIFQMFNLLPYLSVRDNVAAALPVLGPAPGAGPRRGDGHPHGGGAPAGPPGPGRPRPARPAG